MSPPPFPPLPELIKIPEKLQGKPSLITDATRTPEIIKYRDLEEDPKSGKFTLIAYLAESPQASSDRLIKSLSSSLNNGLISSVKLASVGPRHEVMKREFSGLKSDWVIWIDGSTLIRRNNWLDHLQEASTNRPDTGGVGL